ncbi:ninjurin-1 isoform X2 [Zonotrichia albicollis]|uniref:ninjurin-1 isoform X2 n=1 Tax=Zonotrichia albicollis TaxID=44394 RepID=UPI0003941E38|nr:ninjurin-1 isoform X2 [Zonotrichia albicollis]
MDSGSETHELNGTAEGADSAAEEQRRRWQWFQRNRPININHYANKKSAAESMLDIALLMANASQLKAVMEQGPSFSFYVPLIILISLSLTLQVMVGVLLIFLETWSIHFRCHLQLSQLRCTQWGKKNNLKKLDTPGSFLKLPTHLYT